MSINKQSEECNVNIVLEKLMNMGCVTWDPCFAQKHNGLISNVLTNEINYDSISNDNKWGYQFHITSALNKIDVDYNDIDSVRNLIIMNHFVIKMDKDKNIRFETRNPTSVYEIFYYYQNKFNKNIDNWYDPELSDLKILHENFKKNYNQYSFFGIIEDQLNYFVNAVIHLQRN